MLRLCCAFVAAGQSAIPAVAYANSSRTAPGADCVDWVWSLAQFCQGQSLAARRLSRDVAKGQTPSDERRDEREECARKRSSAERVGCANRGRPPSTIAVASGSTSWPALLWTSPVSIPA